VAAILETRRIVLFTLPAVREMDLVGAVDVFASANRAVGGKASLRCQDRQRREGSQRSEN
jgi:hypothetical protein